MRDPQRHPNADGDAHADGHTNTQSHRFAHRQSQSHSHPHSHGHAYPDGHAHPKRISDSQSDPDNRRIHTHAQPGLTDAHSRRRGFAHSHSTADTDLHSHCNAHANSNAQPYGVPNGQSYSYRWPVQPHANAWVSHTNPGISNADTVPNPHTNPGDHSNSHANRSGFPYPIAYPDRPRDGLAHSITHPGRRC